MPVPDPSFTVHVDPDAAELNDLTVAFTAPAGRTADGRPAGEPDVEEHHGAADGGKLAVRARQQAERARSGRAATGKSRYAFRRS
jgi:hypothetical protein